MTTIFVTGGAGFIGSNFVRYWLREHPSDTVLNYDLLTYAGNPRSLDDVAAANGDRYQFVQGDIGDYELVLATLKRWQPGSIVNFAAESHNSRAVVDPAAFFRTNVLGTQRLLDAARDAGVPRFHHISTCEVFGDLELEDPRSFGEDSPYRPRTPYNASKAGADLAVRAYGETFGLPVTISICSNNYGPCQFPEKVIPVFTISGLRGEPLPLYRSSRHRREWLHVEDHCRAIEAILVRGRVGETYNVGSGVELDIEQIADLVLDTLGLDGGAKKYVPDRPGHDRRYLLDSAKIRRELDWSPRVPVEGGIRATVGWYRENPAWWEPLLERRTVDEEAWQTAGSDRGSYDLETQPNTLARSASAIGAKSAAS
jgi:dTDP-glucose 4,6-dehydratase